MVPAVGMGVGERRAGTRFCFSFLQPFDCVAIKSQLTRLRYVLRRMALLPEARRHCNTASSAHPVPHPDKRGLPRSLGFSLSPDTRPLPAH